MWLRSSTFAPNFPAKYALEGLSAFSVPLIPKPQLAAGPHAAADPLERARRQERLQRVEATFHPLPFGVEAARAYGQVYAAVSALGRNPRRRAVDLMIAATAVAVGLPLYTRNPSDFAGLSDLLEVVGVS